MSFIRQYHYDVRSYECDQHHRLKPYVVMNYFEDAAWRHAEEYGFGHRALAERESMWVMSRVNVEFESYPTWGERIAFETWPRGLSGPFALRHFRLLGAEGTAVAGTSSWLIIDREQKRPKRPTEFFSQETLDGMPDVDATPNPPRRIAPQEAQEEHSRFTPDYTSLDVNGHVNNAEFVRWGLDAVSWERLSRYPVSRMEINFLSEVNPGESISVYRKMVSPERAEPQADGEPSTVITEGRRNTDDEPVFRARIFLAASDAYARVSEAVSTR
jgi:acyl-ACP thioesterase